MNRSRTVIGSLVIMSVAGFVVVLTTRNASRADIGDNAQSHRPYFQSDSIILVVSPTDDAVFGFSKHTGKWQKQAVKIAPSQTITPMLSQNVAYFQVGNRLYGFSGRHGNWDSIELEAGSKPEMRMTSDVVVGMTKDRIYAFSALAPAWSFVPVESGTKG